MSYKGEKCTFHCYGGCSCRKGQCQDKNPSKPGTCPDFKYLNENCNGGRSSKSKCAPGCNCSKTGNGGEKKCQHPTTTNPTCPSKPTSKIPAMVIRSRHEASLKYFAQDCNKDGGSDQCKAGCKCKNTLIDGQMRNVCVDKLFHKGSCPRDPNIVKHYHGEGCHFNGFHEACRDPCKCAKTFYDGRWRPICVDKVRGDGSCPRDPNLIKSYYGQSCHIDGNDDACHGPCKCRIKVGSQIAVCTDRISGGYGSCPRDPNLIKKYFGDSCGYHEECHKPCQCKKGRRGQGKICSDPYAKYGACPRTASQTHKVVTKVTKPVTVTRSSEPKQLTITKPVTAAVSSGYYTQDCDDEGIKCKPGCRCAGPSLIDGTFKTFCLDEWNHAGSCPRDPNFVKRYYGQSCLKNGYDDACHAGCKCNFGWIDGDYKPICRDNSLGSKSCPRDPNVVKSYYAESCHLDGYDEACHDGCKCQKKTKNGDDEATWAVCHDIDSGSCPRNPHLVKAYYGKPCFIQGYDEKCHAGCQCRKPYNREWPICGDVGKVGTCTQDPTPWKPPVILYNGDSCKYDKKPACHRGCLCLKDKCTAKDREECPSKPKAVDGAKIFIYNKQDCDVNSGPGCFPSCQCKSGKCEANSALDPIKCPNNKQEAKDMVKNPSSLAAYQLFNNLLDDSFMYDDDGIDDDYYYDFNAYDEYDNVRFKSVSYYGLNEYQPIPIHSDNNYQFEQDLTYLTYSISAVLLVLVFICCSVAIIAAGFAYQIVKYYRKKIEIDDGQTNYRNDITINDDD